MEGIGVVLGGLLLLILLAGGSSVSKRNKYEIEQNQNGYCEVKDDTGNVVFAGTQSDCENWINENE